MSSDQPFIASHGDGDRPRPLRACNHGFSADIMSAKTASYAIMHLVVAIAVAYALTLDWRKALAIGIVEPFVQTFAFALHDRYWRKREAKSAAGDCTKAGQATA